jgi:hypothetical protein
MLRTTGRFLLLGALLAGTALLTAARPARAAELKKDTSLAFAPDDAAFSMTYLRNKEQVDLFYKSNAYKALRELPIVKELWKKAKDDLSKEGQPLAIYGKLLEDKDNKELLDVLAEGLSDEVSVIGGKAWVDLLGVASKLQLAQYAGMLRGLTGQGNPNIGQARGVLSMLMKDRAKLKVPELLIALKLKDAKRADKQLARLYKMADAFIKNNEQAKEQLAGRLKQQKAAGGTFVTLELDGAMLPWAQADLSDVEENKGEFDPLINHLKKMKLTASVGVARGYLVIALTATTKELEAVLAGKGKLLAGRPELAPVYKHEGKKLVEVSYWSGALASASGAARDEVDNLVKEVKKALEKVEQIKEDRRKAINKDLDAFAADLKSMYPKDRAGGASYAWMSERGYEGYSHDYNDHSHLKGVKLDLHNHFGGSPIFAFAFATPVRGTYYTSLVKWAKKVHEHGEAVFLDTAGDEEKDTYKKFTQDAFPLLKKLDEATTKQLIPALKSNGGFGIVIDGKWKSKQWVPVMPKADREMPMVELGLLLSHGDAAKFTAAMTEYRKTLNDLYAKFRENAPDNIPEVKIPVPDADKSGPATVYSWPLPEVAGLDKQLLPTAAVGKTVAALALSKKHAERLAASTPLKVKSGPLATKKALVGACVLDWPAFVDLATPWVETAVRMRAPVPDDEAAAKKAKAALDDQLKQLKVVAEVLKAFRGVSSVTYLEGKGLVTHVEYVVKDVPKVVKAEP